MGRTAESRRIVCGVSAGILQERSNRHSAAPISGQPLEDFRADCDAGQYESIVAPSGDPMSGCSEVVAQYGPSDEHLSFAEFTGISILSLINQREKTRYACPL